MDGNSTGSFPGFRTNFARFYRNVHLNAETPQSLKAKPDEPVWKFPRGVDQRNAGLKWLRQNTLPGPGVLYFMDDDNTYHPQVCELGFMLYKISQ